MDVKTTFLHGDLEEEIYIEQCGKRQRELCLQVEEKSLWVETSLEAVVQEV